MASRLPVGKISANVFRGAQNVKRAVLIAIPVILAVIIFVPIQNRVLYWSLFPLMFLCVYLYHIMEEVVPVKAVVKMLGSDSFFSLKCGLVKVSGDKAELRKGLFVIYSGTVLFYVRDNWKGGAKLELTVPVEAIESYTMCKVDDYHPGLLLTLNGGDEVKFTSRKFAAAEASIRSALGWPEEAENGPQEPEK